MHTLSRKLRYARKYTHRTADSRYFITAMDAKGDDMFILQRRNKSRQPPFRRVIISEA